MPGRYLREGIIDSEPVNALTFPEEVFYRRLMSVVDDFGRTDGRASVLRSRLYPLKIDTVREADITRWIAACEKAGLIALYVVNFKPYILFGKLGEARAKTSKYPAPPPELEERLNRTHAHADANICAQTRADAPDNGNGPDQRATTTTTSNDTPKPPQAGGGVFEHFWSRYPRKENKAGAFKAWNKIAHTPELTMRILDAVEAQRRHGCLEPKTASDGRSVIPHAATWLNGKRWEDEPPPNGKPTRTQTVSDLAAETLATLFEDVQHEPADNGPRIVQAEPADVGDGERVAATAIPPVAR